MLKKLLTQNVKFISSRLIDFRILFTTYQISFLNLRRVKRLLKFQIYNKPHRTIHLKAFPYSTCSLANIDTLSTRCSTQRLRCLLISIGFTGIKCFSSRINYFSSFTELCRKTFPIAQKLFGRSYFKIKSRKNSIRFYLKL